MIVTKRIVLAFVVVLVGAAVCAQGTANSPQSQSSPPTRSSLDRRPDGGAKTLVVVAHGLLGRTATQPLVDLVKQQYPQADILTFDYGISLFSNTNPYLLTSTIEEAIDVAETRYAYDHIILVGHSAGAIFLRKALVWAAGHAEDRPGGPPPVPQTWSTKVDRFVSIAGINRGWTLSPKPQFMKLHTWAEAYIAERVARLTGTGQLVLSFERGAPYIADLRVQWMEYVRQGQGGNALPSAPPMVVQLLGTIDDLVAASDSKDLGISADTCFITVQNTNHADIVGDISSAPGATDEEQDRYSKIKSALTGPREGLGCDQTTTDTKPDISRIVFAMHGIRDYGDWTHTLANRVKKDEGPNGQVVVLPDNYDRFPMVPFLLYWDRQRNVRWFMDQYTEAVAEYPKATFDFVGHSYGTYLLASAMQHYKTPRVRNVYFAGSVVPQKYDWATLIQERRVSRIVNVVATEDWVVAWFPRLFEQIAETFNVADRTGVFDLGAAGFRGFRQGVDAADDIRNIEYISGQHGTGVEMDKSEKLDALANYVERSNPAELDSFRQERHVNGVIDFLSNICWLVWIAILGVAVGIGYVVKRFGTGWLTTYIVLLVALLFTA